MRDLGANVGRLLVAAVRQGNLGYPCDYNAKRHQGAKVSSRFQGGPPVVGCYPVVVAWVESDGSFRPYDGRVEKRLDGSGLLSGSSAPCVVASGLGADWRVVGFAQPDRARGLSTGRLLEYRLLGNKKRLDRAAG